MPPNTSAQIDYVEKGPDFRDVPPLVGDVLAGILGDGEGFVRIGGHIIQLAAMNVIKNVTEKTDPRVEELALKSAHGFAFQFVGRTPLL